MTDDTKDGLQIVESDNNRAKRAQNERTTASNSYMPAPFRVVVDVKHFP